MRIFRRRGEVVPSPNIWYHPETYARENEAQDSDGAVWALLARLVSWAGADVVDVGCGDGFHLPRLAVAAKSVTGVEPHPALVRAARRRVDGHDHVTVRRGTAQRLPLPEASVDVLHARTAYFFGPGCEPGLREADRVLRPGGALVVVDLDARDEPYGEWMRADLPRYRADAVDEFFAEAGFTCHRVRTRWRFPDRAAMEAILRIEFSPRTAERAIVETLRRNRGTEGGPLDLPVGYRVLLRHAPAAPVVVSPPSARSTALSPPSRVSVADDLPGS
ncbi:class I SAM-dependent methyltransferase [Saccharomonospora saliphila]|uniref:class I SAM-dependent methyltransferase n=1 Tax=Saccharomonospora saliphila TaxID=369829 RepID=UPI0003623C77|nr:class I SAM-dependent methyltransferase [Saccharomonospora saliphila]